MKKRIMQIIALVNDFGTFIFLKYFHSPSINENKQIFLNFRNPNLYHRYFYNLVKTLQLGGYSLFYPMSFSRFRNLRTGDPYLALLFQENDLLIIKNIKDKSEFLELNDEMFSADYYKTLFEDDNLEQNAYHIPMSFHPYMYANNLWNKSLSPRERKINSIFAFGNFDRKVYKTIDQYPFNVLNRADLIDYFSKKKNFISVGNKLELDVLIREKTEEKFIFAEKSTFQIPLEEVREYLASFSYFLCCPGVFAPLSHNFIEAMSTGCVPVIEKGYAETIYPKLENGRNAIIFEDLEDLENIINNQLFKKSREEILILAENVKVYYEAFLHPKSVAKNIIKNIEKHPIYLNASERSVKLIKK